MNTSVKQSTILSADNAEDFQHAAALAGDGFCVYIIAPDATARELMPISVEKAGF